MGGTTPAALLAPHHGKHNQKSDQQINLRLILFQPSIGFSSATEHEENGLWATYWTH